MMITAPTLDCLDGIAHGFFGRKGGVSQGPYASLNVSLRNADNRDAAWTNRGLIAEKFGKMAKDLVIARQVHGIGIHEADEHFDPFDPPEADGLVTNRPGQVLGVTSADCAPILMADCSARVIGAAHAGWRGALLGVSDALIAAMERLGARKASINAAIGPCIAQLSYEVGPEFEREFLRADPGNACFFERHETSGKPHFDLEAYLERRLSQAGIKEVHKSSTDTLTHKEDYFSFRRTTLSGEKGFGLQVSAIALKH